MNAVSGQGGGYATGFEAGPMLAYEVVLKVTVMDIDALWHGAARRLREAGLSPQDIDDTVGPQEDPAVSDCLSVLALPEIDGCRITDFQIRACRKASPIVKLAERPSYAPPRPALDRAADLPPTVVCSLMIGTS